MHFEEREVGGFRLYAGAREVTPQCFEAMVVVVRVEESGGIGGEVFRGQRLFGTRLFATPREALDAAFRTALQALDQRHLAEPDALHESADDLRRHEPRVPL